ncbi:MAG: hypothetical protein Q7U54_00305 [Bacteroidales bacterium]|nr:hypothetical protein [Bacteroidales bacterium]
MKRIFKVLALALSLTWLFSINANAQDPADPSIATGTNGATTGVVGGGAGATLASGLYILLLLGGVYGSYKLYEIKQKKNQEQSEEGMANSE